MLEQRVAAVRRFNRFYTGLIGVLQEQLLGTAFSLTESRVLYELAQRPSTTATELCNSLRLDPGYLSRILRGFERRGLISRTPSSTDRRQYQLTLSAEGHDAFAAVDARSQQDVAEMLARLDDASQRQLIGAVARIEALLGPARQTERPAYVLRPHAPGDMGWVAGRHGSLYAEEYGWTPRIEAMAAEVVAAFINNFDPRCEHCWIAEMDGEPVGSVFVIKQSDDVAKLRLLLVEPRARKLGIGVRLVAEAIRFARQHRYRTLSLWTQNVLVAAGRIYQNAGFRLVREEPHRMFGPEMLGQTWELELS
jgi:DNA-binding MarR family transcriptional regulator/GNAT superfamily N-acetyltransferase